MKKKIALSIAMMIAVGTFTGCAKKMKIGFEETFEDTWEVSDRDDSIQHSTTENSTYPVQDTDSSVSESSPEDIIHVEIDPDYENKWKDIPETPASDFNFEDRGYNIVLTKYIGSDTVVKIPREINGVTVGEIGEEAFAGNESITDVYFPDTLTYIGDKAFFSCTGLTEIYIPWAFYIGDSAFACCYSLSNVKIGNIHISESQEENVEEYSVTTHIATGAFCGCDSLTDVTLPDKVELAIENGFNTIIVMSFDLPYEINPEMQIHYGGRTFSGQETVELYDYITNPGGEVVIEDGTLVRCPTTFEGDYVVPEGVTEIGVNAFNDCDGLTGITFSSSVTEILSNAFENCDGLTSVSIPGNVRVIGDFAFQGCSNLKYVDISDGVTKIGNGAFCFCGKLSSVTIPDSVGKIGAHAFSQLSDTDMIVTYRGKSYNKDTVGSICESY